MEGVDLMAIAKKLILAIIVMFGLYHLALIGGNTMVNLQQDEFVSRYLGTYFDAPLPEPDEYIYRYATLSEENNSLYVFHLDVSSWEIKDILSSFPIDIEFQNASDIISYCEYLGYDSDALDAIERIASNFSLDDCSFEEIQKPR